MVDRRRSLRVLALSVALVAVGLAGPAHAQLFDDPFRPDETTTTTTPSSTTTTTTAPPPTVPGTGGGDATTTTTTTTAPPPAGQAPAPGASDAPPEGADQAPPPDGGDGSQPAATSRSVPAEAQAIIDGVVRSPSNGSQALHDGVQELVALGLSEPEAIRIGFGRFPIAGVANFTHDWLFPRYGPGFRFHKGTDVFAPYGTPVRAPVDGTVTAGSGTLGGLYLKVFQSDGTYFYMAHLSGLVDGFQNGMPVQVGDIIGYVGNSGNARTTPPHVHLGIYSPGGEATDPKPVLDQWLADAQAALPEIIERVRAERAQAAPVAEPAPRVPRSLLSTSLLRSLVEERAAASVDTALLFEAVGNPSSGGLAVAQVEASRLAAGIDWDVLEARNRTRRMLAERAEALFRDALGPLDWSRGQQ